MVYAGIIGAGMNRARWVVILLFAVLLLYVSCDKISYEWVKYHDDNEGNAFFYKKGKTTKDGDRHIAQAWGKEVYSAKGKEKELQSRIKDGLSNQGYDKLSYKKCLYEIDCREQKISILSISHYNSDDKILYSGGSDIRRWFEIETNSTSDHLRREVCK